MKTDPKLVSPGETATAQIHVGETAEQLASSEFTLKLRFKKTIERNDLTLTLDGKIVDSLERNGLWLESNCEGEEFRRGRNEVEVSVPADSSHRLIWTDLMIEKRGSHQTANE